MKKSAILNECCDKFTLRGGILQLVLNKFGYHKIVFLPLPGENFLASRKLKNIIMTQNIPGGYSSPLIMYSFSSSVNPVFANGSICHAAVKNMYLFSNVIF